jgi:hypothetical protein
MDEAETVTEGMKQANQMCEKIGMKLDKIISVSEVSDLVAEDEEQGEDSGAEE